MSTITNYKRKCLNLLLINIAACALLTQPVKMNYIKDSDDGIMLAFIVEVSVSLSAGDIATASPTWSSSWFMNDMVAYISRLIVETTPVMRKSPQKLRKFRLFDSTVMLPLFWQFASPIHFFSICSMSSPPVMLRIALEMSATSGEPLVKACPSIGDREDNFLIRELTICEQG